MSLKGSLWLLWRRARQETGGAGGGLQRDWWAALRQHHGDGGDGPDSREITQEKGTGVWDGLAAGNEIARRLYHT